MKVKLLNSCHYGFMCEVELPVVVECRETDCDSLIQVSFKELIRVGASANVEACYWWHFRNYEGLPPEFEIIDERSSSGEARPI